MDATSDEFEFVKASFDGGVVLECWRNYGQTGSERLIEAIWRDEPQVFLVRAAVSELPFALWESFIAEARRWCPTPSP